MGTQSIKASRQAARPMAILDAFKRKPAPVPAAPVKKAAKAVSRKVSGGTTPTTPKKGIELPKVNGKEFPLKIGFTKSNELFVGRLAMLGFSSALIGEILTSKGALAQFGYETGLDGIEVDWFIAGLVLFNLVAAVLPTSQTFVPDEQESLQERPKGPLQNPSISLLNPKQFFAVEGFGFSKENELFVGRAAQLGFAASLIGEVVTGKGPLAQFDFETGINLAQTEYGLLAFIAFLAVAAVNPGTGRFVDDEESE